MKRLFIIIFVAVIVLVSGYVVIVDVYDISPVSYVRQLIRNYQAYRSSPSLQQPIVNYDPLLNDVAPKLIQDTNEIVALLKRDRGSFDGWMSLAINLKILGDFNRARDAWEFATLLQPTNPLPFHNLGTLYSLELKDADRAEPYFVTALRYAGDQVFIYYSAYEFYRFVKKDITRARAVLEDGIAQNPLQAKSLQGALNSLKSL